MSTTKTAAALVLGAALTFAGCGDEETPMDEPGPTDMTEMSPGQTDQTDQTGQTDRTDDLTDLGDDTAEMDSETGDGDDY